MWTVIWLMVLELAAVRGQAMPRPPPFFPTVQCEENVAVLEIATRDLPQNVTELSFRDCDLKDFDFGWLARFPHLELLEVWGGSLVEFKGLPSLPHLKYVTIDSSEFGRWYGAGLTPQLEAVSVAGVAGDVAIDRILESLLSYEATLKYLVLPYSSLTRIPPAVRRFTHLRSFHFFMNPLTTTLTSGTFPATFAPKTVSINACNITNIEPGTFAGEFGGRSIRLAGSTLPSLDEAVFGHVLRSMHNAGDGGLFLQTVGSCDCGLAWLVRDNPHLMQYVEGAECLRPGDEDWTQISDLEAATFTNCPVKSVVAS